MLRVLLCMAHACLRGVGFEKTLEIARCEYRQRYSFLGIGASLQIVLLVPSKVRFQLYVLGHTGRCLFDRNAVGTIWQEVVGRGSDVG